MGLFHNGEYGDTADCEYIFFFSPPRSKPVFQARRVVRMEGVRSYGALRPFQGTFWQGVQPSTNWTTATSRAAAGLYASGTSHQTAVTSWATRKYFWQSGNANPSCDTGHIGVVRLNLDGCGSQRNENSLFNCEKKELGRIVEQISKFREYLHFNKIHSA